MDCYVSDIIAEVRKALDENETNVPLIELGDVDTLSLDAIIRQKIPDGVRSVTAQAPSFLLDGGVRFGDTVYWENMVGKGMGYVPLPDDFMRLVVFQMSDWRVPVFTAIADTDALYLQQKSRFTGIRGGTERPVCVVTTHATGKVLEFYSCAGGDAVGVKVARYLGYPVIRNERIGICSKLVTPVVYYTAGLVCNTYKDSEHAKGLFELATVFLK